MKKRCKQYTIEVNNWSAKFCLKLTEEVVWGRQLFKHRFEEDIKIHLKGHRMRTKTIKVPIWLENT